MDGQCRKNWCSIPWKFTWTSPETKKIKNVEKPVSNLYDKNEYVIQIRNLRQALNHRLILKIVHRVVKFTTLYCLYWYEYQTKTKSKKLLSEIFQIFFQHLLQYLCKCHLFLHEQWSCLYSYNKVLHSHYISIFWFDIVIPKFIHYSFT